jgi:hypothetical protein
MKLMNLEKKFGVRERKIGDNSSEDMILRYSMPGEEDRQKAVEHIY